MKPRPELRKNLDQCDLACSFTSCNNGVREAVTDGQPDVILFEIGEQVAWTGNMGAYSEGENGNNLPVIALITGDALEIADVCLDTA